MYTDIINEHNMRTKKVINVGAVRTREGSEDQNMMLGTGKTER